MTDTFTTADRREIAGRARTIHERLDGPRNERGGGPPLDPDEVLAAWRDQFPDEETFRTRLDHEGLTESAIRDQIAATRWPEDEPLPDWLDELESLVRYVETNRPETLRSVPDDTAFAELLAVVAEYARDRLPADGVPDDALSEMVEGSVTQLFLVCVRPFYVEFKSFVEYQDAELAAADPDDFEDPPSEYYDQFVDAMFEHGFENLCVEYPVLARQLVGMVDNWVGAVTELCRRLEADRAALRDRFGVEGAVTNLEPLSDDAHAEGRLPVRVSFESGEVIYKPRDVSCGFALYEILERLDQHLSTPSLETPTYLRRDDYGWMEPVEYADLPDGDAATRYYERAGVLACAAYALNLPDCQFENLIAVGETPTLVDGETLFHPHIDPNARPSLPEVSTLASRSVLQTLLFPWSVGDPRQAHDDEMGVSHAGFGSSSDVRYGERTRPWVESVNTDVMSVTEKHPEVDLSTNTPSVDGEDAPPREHMDALLRGFSEAHETIRDLHADGRFFTEIAPPDLVEGAENRLVYRSTARYGKILRTAAARDPLRDGARLTAEFEQLTPQFFGDRSDAQRYWPLYEAERRALRRRDIPRFASRPTDRTLFHDGEPLGVRADATGYERCRRQVESMDAEDAERQKWLMQYAFDPGLLDDGTPPAAAVSEDEFETAAVELFDDALDAAFETADRDRWVSISPTQSGIDLYPTDPSLYHGRGGIALTAAALYEVTGEDRYRDRVEATLAPLVEGLEADELVANIGGMLGIGSIVYVLSVAGDLLDDETYRRAASRAVRTVDDDHIERDRTFDVLEGSAGTLLGLLAYYDRCGDEAALDRAVTCGDRLLEGRTSVGSNRTWKTSEEKSPLTGFSHGSSGIAYALARLSAATGESRFADAVGEALDFEADLYDESRTNWAKSHADRDYVDKWCHGRSGVALARLGIGEQLGDESLVADAEAALAVTASAEPSNMDHLCCGNLGRAETLLVGSRRGIANRADAVELARRTLTRREQSGALSMTGHSAALSNPAFFHGLSGAAYTLLRLENPDALPSVLLLE